MPVMIEAKGFISAYLNGQKELFERCIPLPFFDLELVEIAIKEHLIPVFMKE